MRHTRGAVAEIDADGLIRRQKMTTWGILAFAVFVSVGMAEWSKRTAVGETVIDPAVMEEAVKIAAAAASNVKVNVNENLGGELPNLESGKRISDLSGGSRVAGGGLPATSNPKHATLRSESVATMQTSAGGEK